MSETGFCPVCRNTVMVEGFPPLPECPNGCSKIEPLMHLILCDGCGALAAALIDDAWETVDKFFCPICLHALLREKMTMEELHNLTRRTSR